MQNPHRNGPAQMVRDAAVLLVLAVLAFSVRIDLPGKAIEGPLTHAGTEVAGIETTDAAEESPSESVDPSVEVSVPVPPASTAPAVLEFRLPGEPGDADGRGRVRWIVVDDQGQARVMPPARATSAARCSAHAADLAS